MNKDIGRVASPNRLSSATEPEAGLGPPGFDPAREEGKPRSLPKRARTMLDPFWRDTVKRVEAMDDDALRAFMGACRLVSPINCPWYHYAIAKMAHDLAVWTLAERDSDGSPEGEKPQALSAKHDSEGPQDIAQPSGDISS